MFAIAYLFFFALYLFISIFLAWGAAKMAQAGGTRGWKWGLPVLLLMLGLVFWDWIPMEVMFRYKCASALGYSQYKTLDAWKRENPGVSETLLPTKNTNYLTDGNRERYTLNQRFAWDINHKDHWFHIREREEVIVDTLNGEVLARYVDFDTDIPPLGIGGEGFSAYKIWMMKESCEADSSRPLERRFRLYKYLIQYQKEYKK